MRSLDRILAILDAVAATPSGASAAQVEKLSGLPLSTVSRLLHQLAEVGLVERLPDESYVLGMRLVGLARSRVEGDLLVQRARPVMEHLRDLTGETVSLHVSHGSQRMCIAAVASKHPVHRVVSVGLALPLLGTATGLALMAGLREEEIAEIVESDPTQMSVEPTVLKKRLETVQQQGYAMVVDDWVSGLAGLSVPVYREGRPIAAVSISGPSNRWTHNAILEQATRVLKAVRDLET